MSTGIAWVQVGFHLDKFDSDWVERNRVPYLGSYLFYHLTQFAPNGPNLPEQPRELGLEMWTRTTGSRSGQIKRITMEPNDDVIDMNLRKMNKRKNLYQVALLSTFYKGDHGGLIIQ